MRVGCFVLLNSLEFMYNNLICVCRWIILLDWIFTKVFSFFFCSSPKKLLAAYLTVCACAMCSYSYVCALRLLCWSVPVPIHQLPHSSRLSLPENWVPESLLYFFLLYAGISAVIWGDLSSFVMKTLKNWEREEGGWVHRRVVVTQFHLWASREAASSPFCYCSGQSDSPYRL